MQHMDYDLRIERIMNGQKDEYKRITSILKALRRELAKFDYDGDHQKLSNFLIQINKMRPRLATKKQKIIDAEIVKLHGIVRNIITERPSYIARDNPNFLELRKIIDNLEGMNISYMYNYINKYDGNAYNLFRYLLFREKNLFFVEYALEKYPHFINIKDKKGHDILTEVVDKYLSAIDSYTKSNLEYSDDLFYYDQVLDDILGMSKLEYSLEMRKNFLNKISKYLDDYDYSNIDIKVKNKLIFWINELKNKVEMKECNETLPHLSYKTDITIDFNEAILSEARRFSLSDVRSEFVKREHVKDEYIITVDGEQAEEIDDGLSICKLPNGNFWLGVHISDPSGYVSKNSILYDEAYHRTTSIYSPLERTSSMFPEEHAKNFMSLIEGKNRLSTSYYLEITPDGEILLDNCVFKKTVVNVDKQLTYNKFNDIANNGTENEMLMETINNLQELSQSLSKKIKMDENYRLANRDDTNASGTNITGNSNSERIIENAMMATNMTVANYAAKNGFPFIYRGHEISGEYLNKINYFDKKFKDNPTIENYDVFVKILKNTYPAAFYTTDSNIGHMGLGIDHYCHLTSPLRRFADCLANEALELFYFNSLVDDKEVYKFEDRLNKGCRHINEKKKTIDYFTGRYGEIKEK